MKSVKLVLVLGVVAVAYGLPLEEQHGKNLITGVFIPSDAFKNLQDRANANSPNNNQVQNPQPTYQVVSTNQPQYQQPNTNQQYQPVNGNQPQYQPVNTNQQQYQPVNTNQPQYQAVNTNPPQYLPVNTNQPQYQPVNTNQPQYQTAVITNQQPAQNNQQPTVSNQPIVIQSNPPPVLTNQPISNQPNVVYTQQPLTANRDPNQPIMVMTNQPQNQPGQSIMLVQQPSTSSNQPMYVQQPNQQPIQVIFGSNPSYGNQVQGTLVQSPNQNQPGSTVYTLIPLNNQNNLNSSPGGSYLIPVQSGSSNPIILSTGK
ncbi:hypothetical protein PYW07_016946 [Mythimna separata]|uniref:Uncharacterized protein n=1 Tax=Mythimna separata TaxID=271217 RepID=A0AAD7YW93_MYTSE|nr:hypothetical protein PYW07_016946 [Mythimna separata]